jgi:hypothetical protein
MKFGYCPHCGAPGVNRERRPDGYDTCKDGHKYLTRHALTTSARNQHIGEVCEHGKPKWHCDTCKAWRENKTIEALEEAVRVLAAEVNAAWQWNDSDDTILKTWPDATSAAVRNHPLASAAVKKAGGA